MASFLDRRNRNLNLLGEVRMDSCALFRNFTRMRASDFVLLLQLIGPSTKKRDTNMREAIPISRRLAVTLRFFSHWWLVSYSYVYISYISASNIDHHTTLRTGSFKLFKRQFPVFFNNFNSLNAELNPICYLLALLAHHFLHVSRIRVKSLTLRLLMSYIYIYIWNTHSWCF